MAKPKLPEREAIRDYWFGVYDETDMNVDWCDALDRCWRCTGQPGGNLDRCHIIPNALDGTATPENLVLLCRRCHEEARSTDFDPSAMWTWIRSARRDYYGAFTAERVLAAYVDQYGELPYLGRNLTSADVAPLIDRCGIHFKSMWTWSTLATVLRRVVESGDAAQGELIPRAEPER